MADITIQQEDMDAPLSEEVRSVMLQLILTWAQFDNVLTHFLLFAYGASVDEGTLLIGQMDTRTKIDKLKAVYLHHGMEEEAESIRNLSAIHKHYVGVRNAIAHQTCRGMWKRQPDLIVFVSGRISKGRKGKLEAQFFSIQHMRDAISFAHRAALRLAEKLNDKSLLPSKPPLAPPSFQIQSDPTPPRSAKGKRGKLPPTPQA